MNGFPARPVPVDHVEPVPRRIRAFLGGETVLDTIRARYVWEHPHYPQFYVPLDDVRPDFLIHEERVAHTRRGPVDVYGLRLGSIHRPTAARVLTDAPIDGLTGTVRFEWEALDAWFEEDEQIYVHPRDPYTRVDALRSSRRLRVELEGVVLAESASPVMVFETGLPTRYYLARTSLAFQHLVPSPTMTACPYKGTTSQYWSALIDSATHEDVAWSYAFPTTALAPIAGLVAFYNERVDLFLDGQPLERPPG